jgi:hypothetical protein
VIFGDDIISTTATAIAVGAIIGVALGALDELRLRLRARTALEDAARADRERAEATDDPKVLRDYLVDRIGAMSISAFAQDADARRFVTRAADRADGFVNSATASTASHEDHLTAARTLITAGEIPGGLARLRLAVEQAVSAQGDDDEGRREPWKALRRAAAELPAEAGPGLEQAVHTANRGLHGQDVTQDEALAACRAVEHALQLLAAHRRRATP